MGRKPAPKPDDLVQSKRFIETAEQVGADIDDEALECAFKKIAPPKATSTNSSGLPSSKRRA